MSQEETVKVSHSHKIRRILLLLLLAAAAVFILYRFHLKKEIRQRIEVIRSAGYPVTCEELDKWYAIPDGVENAAYVILDAASIYWTPKETEFFPIIGKAVLPARTEPLTPEMMKAISQYLTDNKKTLELLHKVSAIEYSRYPTDLSLGYTQFPSNHYSDMRDCINLLGLESIYLAEDANSQASLESIKSMFNLARSFKNEPLLISQLVRLSFQNAAATNIERVINRTDFTDEQLKELTKILSDASSDTDSLKRGIVGERCIMLNSMELMMSDSLSRATMQMQESGIPAAALFPVYKAVGLLDSDIIIYLDTIEKVLNVLDLPLDERWEASRLIDAKIAGISKIHVFLLETMPSFRGYILPEIRTAAGLRAAQTAIAIQRYRLAQGKLPDSLTEFVPEYLESIPLDPFDGKELRYRKLPQGYVVYSIGEDLSDDNGQERAITTASRQVNPNFDITFTVER
jgi:hypothetical protein